MSLLDLLTGGKSSAAENALEDAEKIYASIPIPNAAQLTLPELQKYVQAGILTPAQAQAALIKGNAYNDIKVDPSSMEAEQKALGQLQEVAADNGLTPQMKAQIAAAQDQAETSGRGAREAILDQMAQRGVSTSLLAPAAMMEETGDAARTQNLADTQAAGQAEQNALNAIMNSGNLASTIHGQNYSEEANKAAAENAIRQWNAGTQSNVNESNAQRAQAANAANAQNAQDVSNKNADTANYRTEYNAQIPQTIFNDQATKASGMAGIKQSEANNLTNQGNQIMGLIGSGIGDAAIAFAPGMEKLPATKPPVAAAHGAVVPGKAEVPGDSPRNDKVHALLSPGEIVVPRSIAHNPDQVKGFVTHLLKNKPVAPVHPDDVHSVLEALNKRRVA